MCGVLNQTARDRWLHHWVWLLGEEEEAAHFLYEITAFKGNTK